MIALDDRAAEQAAYNGIMRRIGFDGMRLFLSKLFIVQRIIEIVQRKLDPVYFRIGARQLF